MTDLAAIQRQLPARLSLALLAAALVLAQATPSLASRAFPLNDLRQTHQRGVDRTLTEFSTRFRVTAPDAIPAPYHYDRQLRLLRAEIPLALAYDLGLTPARRAAFLSTFSYDPPTPSRTCITQGLGYARALAYDPGKASWLCVDPLGPVDSPNLYQAFGLDPHNNTDPMGLAAVVTNNGMVVIADDNSDTKTIMQRRALAVKDKHSRERIAFLMRELGGLDQDQVNTLLIKLYRAEKEAYARAATQLGVDEQAIRAVAQVETMKQPFLSTGHPTVLFERHKFHHFTGGAFDQAAPDLSNPSPGGYGSVSGQPARLARAKALDKTAAIKSASWGQFQIMGFNYAAAGYGSPQQFERAMRTTELEHLEAFVSFVGANPGILNALRLHNWPAFAYGYNGPAYATNHYDLKMDQAYKALTRAQQTP